MNEDQTPENDSTSSASPGESRESSADGVEPSIPSDSQSPPVSTPAAGNDRAVDELPEWEPLTPELVEDEAIRADFMLRWAVVLLAFLFGFTEIIATQTLVHIRSGEYLANHGILPPGTDVFSYTAGETPWIQLNWLFDLIVAGIHHIAGGLGLTLLKSVIAAVTLGVILRISRTGVSTWWNSICAAVLVIACYHHWTARPEIVTLLGTALTMYWLHRWTEGDIAVRWKIPACLAIWVNLDPFGFVGLMLVTLFVLGQLVDRQIGASSPHEQTVDWRIILGASLVACLVNPFLWHSLTEPLVQYGEVYPAMRSYYGVSETVQPQPSTLLLYPLTDPLLWKWIDVPAICGLALVGLALFALLMNRRQFSFAQLFVLAGCSGLALMAAHELAITAVVATTIAGLNIQQWYQRTFRQTYSTETSELLFSRGGRALTVLALFGVAFLVISGRFALPQERRIGIGFDENLLGIMQRLPEELSDELDDRTFNFRLEQGDLLIWAGQKVFADSRVSLFTPGDPSVLDKHDAARRAMRSEDEALPGSGKPEVWKAILDEYDVTHVIPRLYAPNPDYTTYFDLLLSPDWQLTQLGANSASFYRRDLPQNTDLTAYLEKHQTNFIAEAFQRKEPQLVERIDWARPPGFYEQYLTLPENVRSPELQRAIHFFRLLTVTPAQIADLKAAYAHLVIQQANLALAENAQDVEAFRVLGIAYAELGQLESQLSAGPQPQAASPSLSPMRYLQAVMALNQAATIEPDSFDTHVALYNLYSRMNKIDLRLRELDAVLRLQQIPEDLSPEQLDAIRSDQEQAETLRKQRDDIAAEVRKAIDEKGDELTVDDLMTLAGAANQAGCTLLSLELIDEHFELIEQVPPALLTRASMLLESGDVEIAYEELGKLESIAEQSGLVGWYFPAAMASLANGDYVRATKLWYDELRMRESQQDLMLRQALLFTLPLVGNPVRTAWPLTQLRMNEEAAITWPNQLASIRLQVVACHLEAGQTREAIALIKTMLEESPDSDYRRLLRVYLAVTGDELIDLETTLEWFEPDADSLLPKLGVASPAGSEVESSSTPAANN